MRATDFTSFIAQLRFVSDLAEYDVHDDKEIIKFSLSVHVFET